METCCYSAHTSQEEIKSGQRVSPYKWGSGHKKAMKGEKMVVKEKIWSGCCCQKFLVSRFLFEPITTQSQPVHVSIFVHQTFTGMSNSFFFASFSINTPSSKSRDGCKLLEPIFVPLLYSFVHTSGTSRWWSGRSDSFCILAPAEKLCTHDQKIARHAIFHTPILQLPPQQLAVLNHLITQLAAQVEGCMPICHKVNSVPLQHSLRLGIHCKACLGTHCEHKHLGHQHLPSCILLYYSNVPVPWHTLQNDACQHALPLWMQTLGSQTERHVNAPWHTMQKCALSNAPSVCKCWKANIGVHFCIALMLARFYCLLEGRCISLLPSLFLLFSGLLLGLLYCSIKCMMSQSSQLTRSQSYLLLWPGSQPSRPPSFSGWAASPTCCSGWAASSPGFSGQAANPTCCSRQAVSHPGAASPPGFSGWAAICICSSGWTACPPGAASPLSFSGKAASPSCCSCRAASPPGAAIPPGFSGQATSPTFCSGWSASPPCFSCWSASPPGSSSQAANHPGSSRRGSHQSSLCLTVQFSPC